MAMARRTRTSASSLRRRLNSMVLVRALPSLPLVETVKRASFEPRDVGQRQAGIRAELHLPASIAAAAAARSGMKRQTMRSR